MEALRDYQETAILDTRRAAARSRKVVLQMPTGAGKTIVAGDLVGRAIEKGKRVAFLVPYISLVQQTVDSLAAQGIVDVGVVQGQNHLPMPHLPVQVCSIETLARRKEFLDADLVIVDECHRRSKFTESWMDDGAHFVGLSATPWARGMGKVWDDLVIGATAKELIERKYLSDYRVFAPSKPDLEGVKTVAGEWHQGQLEQRVRSKVLIASIVETWLAKSSGDKTFCFAVNRAHAAEIQAEFLRHDVNAAYIDAHTTIEDRQQIEAGFHLGAIKVVCNVGCLVAGVDWDVRTLILAASTKSEIKFVQMVGRALRTADGKDHALILDHSDTTERLGMPDDIHHEHLDDGKPKEAKPRKEKLPKPCPSCGALKTPGPCPACGFKPDPRSGVEVEDGELVEITKSKKPKYTKQQSDIYWVELCSYAKEKGYKLGWAKYTLMEMTGHEAPGKYWPNRQAVPGEKVRNFIKHKMIKHARRIGGGKGFSQRNEKNSRQANG